MTVVLIPIVADHGADGVLVVGVLAGLMLLLLAFTGAGRAMKYMPLPVVEGFTAGIAVIIALQQLPAALGVDVDGEKVLGLAWDAIKAWLDAPVWQAPVMTLAVAAGIVVAARIRSGFPAALVLVAAATAINMLADSGLKTIGYIPSTLAAPRWPQIPWEHLDSLLLAAVAVAALGALESLLSATVADAMTVGERHDPDREFFGQGVANVVAPLFGGIPATAAIARTAVNVRAGAGTRLAAVFHSLLLLVAVLVAASLTPGRGRQGGFVVFRWLVFHAQVRQSDFAGLIGGIEIYRSDELVGVIAVWVLDDLAHGPRTRVSIA